MFSFFYVVLLTGWYWETKDCSVAGEGKICNLYRVPVPVNYPSGVGSRALGQAQSDANCIWCEKGGGAGDVFFRNKCVRLVSGAFVELKGKISWKL